MEDKVNKILLEHFEDDKKQFERLNELCMINGNHLSYFNKNLEEVKSMLKEQNRINLDQQKILTEHIERVEPMLTAFEEENKFRKKLGLEAKKWSIRIGMASSLIAALYVIKAFLANLLK